MHTALSETFNFKTRSSRPELLSILEVPNLLYMYEIIASNWINHHHTCKLVGIKNKFHVCLSPTGICEVCFSKIRFKITTWKIWLTSCIWRLVGIELRGEFEGREKIMLEKQKRRIPKMLFVVVLLDQLVYNLWRCPALPQMTLANGFMIEMLGCSGRKTER